MNPTPLQVATKLIEICHARPVTLVKLLIEQIDSTGDRTAALQRLADAGLIPKDHLDG